jgi:hypothetical protein
VAQRSDAPSHDELLQREEPGAAQITCGLPFADDLNSAMVVAVTLVGAVESAIHQVVDVVSVWDRGMAATRLVDVSIAGLDRVAAVRILLAEIHGATMHVVAMGDMQVTIMRVGDIVAHLDGYVAATGTVIMLMLAMGASGTLGHHILLPCVRPRFGTSRQAILRGLTIGSNRSIESPRAEPNPGLDPLPAGRPEDCPRAPAATAGNHSPSIYRAAASLATARGRLEGNRRGSAGWSEKRARFGPKHWLIGSIGTGGEVVAERLVRQRRRQ